MATTVQENFDSFIALPAATATGTQSTTTLQDTSQSWTPNAYQSAGTLFYVTIISGTGAGQQRKITSNTSNTLTLAVAWTTTPVAGSSVYMVSQVATSWANPTSQNEQFLVAQRNSISGANAFGVLGGAIAGNMNLLSTARTSSTSAGDGCMQLSQILNYTSGNCAFICPMARWNSVSSGSVFAFTNFSAAGTNVNFYCNGVGNFQNSPNYNISKTFASGSTVVSKFETQNMTDGNSIPYLKERFKAWQSGTSEPGTWDLTYNEYGVSINNPGSGYGAGPVGTLSSSGNPTNVIYFNVVGGAIVAGILSQVGYGQVFTTAPTITISGGGGTGATATCALDSDGHITTITITAGGSAYNNSPTLAYSGTGTGATAILATNASGQVAAIKSTAPGSNYTTPPTYIITGTGTGATIRYMWNQVAGTVSVYTTGTYRGAMVYSVGTAPSDPFFDDYFEGSVGTTFGGGQSIAVNATGIFYSPGNWYLNGSTSATTNNNGAYVKFSFTGTSIAATFAQLTTTEVIRYSVDNGPWQNATLPNGTNIFSFASGLTAGTHQIIIFANANNVTNDRWNTPTECLNITNFQIDTAATVSAPSLIYSNSLLIFGDSITEGYSAGGGSIVDAQGTWVAPLAHALQCEYGQIGFSASGFITAGAGNVPAFSTSYQYYSSGKSRMSGALFSFQPTHILIPHGVNGTWVSLDAANTWANIRVAAPNCNLFQLLPFGGQNRVLFVGTNIAGTVSTATSTTLTANGTPFNSTYANCSNMIVVAISSGGVKQVRVISPSGNGNSLLNVTVAWTTIPDNTYSFKVMTAYEYYLYAYPTDKKFYFIDLGTDIQKGLTGSGPATQQSVDQLHPLNSYAGHLSTPVYNAMYQKLNPPVASGNAGNGSLIF